VSLGRPAEHLVRRAHRDREPARDPHQEDRPVTEARIVKGWKGRYFEDFEVGDIYQHPLGRTITAADNAWFTLLTMNTNEMHFNDHYAAASTFGKQLVNSGLTVAMILGISVSDVSQNAMANLSWKDIELTHPVFVGDTLYAQSLVLDTRESNSRPYAGIVTVKTQGLNQDGDVIMTFQRSVMVYKRDADQDKGLFPTAKVAITDGVDLD
jgi:itaconyl-CoA hydratase